MSNMLELVVIVLLVVIVAVGLYLVDAGVTVDPPAPVTTTRGS